MIREEKLADLKRRLEALSVKDDDFEERFITGGGKGGQKQNKTASCVYLKHLPTGLTVKCQKDRSREINRFLAKRQLCEQLESKVLGKKSKKELASEKAKKQKKRRKRRQVKEE